MTTIPKPPFRKPLSAVRTESRFAVARPGINAHGIDLLGGLSAQPLSFREKAMNALNVVAWTIVGICLAVEVISCCAAVR